MTSRLLRWDLAALGMTGAGLYALGFPLMCYLATRRAHRHRAAAQAVSKLVPASLVGEAAAAEEPSDVAQPRHGNGRQILLSLLPPPAAQAVV